MGGQNESTVERSSEKGKLSAGKIRMHVAKGEAHFHDDEAKIKVSVPVSDFYVALHQLKQPQRAKKKISREWRFIDTVNNTMVVIENKVTEPENAADFGDITTTVNVYKMAGNDTFSALQKL